MKTKNKILFWDIETLPNVVASWGLWKQNIPLSAVMQENSLLSVAWQWEHNKKVNVISRRTHSEKEMLKIIREILTEADIIVHHNGDSFDLKYLNGRLFANGLTALPKMSTIDTYKVAKSKMRLLSNKLDHLAKLSGVETKFSVDMSLWMRCLTGDKKAYKELESYNKQDVIVLRMVYDQLRTYIPVLHQHEEGKCHHCGSDRLTKRGYVTTKSGKKQRYQCQDCGSWFVSSTNEETNKLRGT